MTEREAVEIEVARGVCKRAVNRGVIRSPEYADWLGAAWEIVHRLAVHYDPTIGPTLGQFVGHLAYVKFREEVYRDRGQRRGQHKRKNPPLRLVPLDEWIGVPAPAREETYHEWRDVELLGLDRQRMTILQRLREIGYKHRVVAREFGIARCTVSNTVQAAKNAARRKEAC